MPNTLCDLDEADAAAGEKPVSTPVRLHLPQLAQRLSVTFATTSLVEIKNKTKKNLRRRGDGGGLQHGLVFAARLAAAVPC